MIANDVNTASNISFQDVQIADTGDSPHTEDEWIL